MASPVQVHFFGSVDMTRVCAVSPQAHRKWPTSDPAGTFFIEPLIYSKLKRRKGFLPPGKGRHPVLRITRLRVFLLPNARLGSPRRQVPGTENNR